MNFAYISRTCDLQSLADRTGTGNRTKTKHISVQGGHIFNQFTLHTMLCVNPSRVTCVFQFGFQGYNLCVFQVELMFCISKFLTNFVELNN